MKLAAREVAGDDLRAGGTVDRDDRVMHEVKPARYHLRDLDVLVLEEVRRAP